MTIQRAAPVLVLLGVVLACNKSATTGRGSSLASVVSSEGRAELEHAGAWRPALPGAALAAGDALRTAAGATVRVRFRTGRHLDVGEKSLVRLGRSPDDSILVTIELGHALIEGDGELSVATYRGPARLDAQTRMRVRAEDGRTRYEILVGRAVLGEGATELVVGAGEGFALVLGRAEVERYRLTVGAAEIEEAPAGSTTALSDDQTEPRQPTQRPDPKELRRREAREQPALDEQELDALPPPPVDLLVPPGESAVIHAPHSPVTVRFDAPAACADKPALRLSPRPRAAPRDLHVSLRPGRYPYDVRCGGRRVAAGVVRVVRDPGLRQVPRKPPVNELDSDGRRYTVLFQNQLPAVTVRWRDLPVAATGPYGLHVTSGTRSQRFESAAPLFRLPSGQLGEGAHVFWINPAQGPASPPTRLQIRFDNASIAGQVRAPPDGVEVPPDGDIEVAGVAMAGSAVAVAGTRLPTDAQGRFEGRVPVPAPDRRAIAIRLEHPRGGVHYYVRRILRLE